MGRTPPAPRHRIGRGEFQLTRPAWGEPLCGYAEITLGAYFNSLAPRGANQTICIAALIASTFQLTRPAWGEPCNLMSYALQVANFNSLAPRGANHGGSSPCFFLLTISTHSPRVGRTTESSWSRQRAKPISTHSPRVGRTDLWVDDAVTGNAFQLTRLAWGEPARLQFLPPYRRFQLTRPAWGEPAFVSFSFPFTMISTHSPRVGRTLLSWHENTPSKISTHSPRVGRTRTAWGHC